MSKIDWANATDFEVLAEINAQLSATDFDQWATCPESVLEKCLLELRNAMSPYKRIATNVLKGASGAALFQEDWPRAIWAKRIIDTPNSDLYGCDREQMATFIQSQTQSLIAQKGRARGWEMDAVMEGIETLLTEDFIGDREDSKAAIPGLLFLTALRCRNETRDKRKFISLAMSCTEAICYHRAGLHNDADDLTRWMIGQIPHYSESYTPDEKEMLGGGGLMRILHESDAQPDLHRAICETCMKLFSADSEELADCMYWLSECLIKDKEFAQADELLEKIIPIAQDHRMTELLALTKANRSMIEAKVTGDASVLAGLNDGNDSGFALGNALAAFGDLLSKMQSGEKVALTDLADFVEKNFAGIAHLKTEESHGEWMYGHYVILVRMLCALEQETMKRLIAAMDESKAYRETARPIDIQEMDALISSVKSFGRLITSNHGAG